MFELIFKNGKSAEHILVSINGEININNDKYKLVKENEQFLLKSPQNEISIEKYNEEKYNSNNNSILISEEGIKINCKIYQVANLELSKKIPQIIIDQTVQEFRENKEIEKEKEKNLGFAQKLLKKFF